MIAICNEPVHQAQTSNMLKLQNQLIGRRRSYECLHLLDTSVIHNACRVVRVDGCHHHFQLCSKHNSQLSDHHPILRENERLNIRSIAKLLPIHILPPLPKAQNHLFFSSPFSLPCSNQRSGSHLSGSGKTSSFRCSEYACACTWVSGGMSVKFPSVVGVEGVIRGKPLGVGECNRRVSVITAWRNGRLSISFEGGRC